MATIHVAASKEAVYSINSSVWHLLNRSGSHIAVVVFSYYIQFYKLKMSFRVFMYYIYYIVVGYNKFN